MRAFQLGRGKDLRGDGIRTSQRDARRTRLLSPHPHLTGGVEVEVFAEVVVEVRPHSSVTLWRLLTADGKENTELADLFGLEFRMADDRMKLVDVTSLHCDLSRRHVERIGAIDVVQVGDPAGGLASTVELVRVDVGFHESLLKVDSAKAGRRKE
jgi:hypothetical protein